MLSGAETAGQMRRLVRELRTEAGGHRREAIAVGVGVFIGALPVYGLHLVLCLAAGSLLRLNRLKLYVAANISNPLMAPLLIMSEIQAGALARRGELQSMTLSAVKAVNPWTSGGDLIVGSLIVGALLGLTLGAATYVLTRNPEDDPFFADLVRRASERFVTSSIVAWEFARGKLAGDPLYRAVVMNGVLPAGGAGTVDLTKLALNPPLGSDVVVPIDATASNLTVVIPATVPVHVQADMTMGNLHDGNQDRGGMTTQQSDYNTAKPGARLVLEISGTVSNVTIKEGN